MGKRRAALILLLTLACGGVSLRGSDQKTAFDQYLATGDAALRASRYVEARKWLTAAVEEARKSDPSRLGLALNHLANLYSRMGEDAKASELRKQAVAADQQMLGPADPRVISDLGGQAFSCYLNNQDAKAEKLFKQALELADRNPDVPDYQRTNLLNNLCELYMRQQRYADCEPLLERALTIVDNSSQLWNLQEVAILRHSLANVYRKEGKEAEAQELENHAFDGIHTPGDPSQNAVQVAMAKADDAYRRGDGVAAENGYQEVIAVTENQGNPYYTSSLAFALDGLGRLCASQGRDDEAESYFLRSIAVREQDASPRTRSTVRSFGYLVVPLLNLYQTQGRLFDMEPVYEGVLASQEKALGPDDEGLADTLLLFAELYRQEEKYHEALPLLARAVEIQEKNLGPSRRLADTLGQYADLLQKLDEKDEADAVRARQSAILKQLGPPSH